MFIVEMAALGAIALGTIGIICALIYMFVILMNLRRTRDLHRRAEEHLRRELPKIRTPRAAQQEV